MAIRIFGHTNLNVKILSTDFLGFHKNWDSHSISFSLVTSTMRKWVKGSNAPTECRMFHRGSTHTYRPLDFQCSTFSSLKVWIKIPHRWVFRVPIWKVSRAGILIGLVVLETPRSWRRTIPPPFKAFYTPKWWLLQASNHMFQWFQPHVLSCLYVFNPIFIKFVSPSFPITKKMYMGVSENSVPLFTQWFCWSLFLLNGYFIGNIAYFQTKIKYIPSGNLT